MHSGRILSGVVAIVALLALFVPQRVEAQQANCTKPQRINPFWAQALKPGESCSFQRAGNMCINCRCNPFNPYCVARVVGGQGFCYMPCPEGMQWIVASQLCCSLSATGTRGPMQVVPPPPPAIRPPPVMRN